MTNGATGLTSYAQDGFNTAYPYYNGEALEYNRYNTATGTQFKSYTSLHQVDSVVFSDPTLNSTFARDYDYDAAGRIFTAIQPGTGTRKVYYYDVYGQLSTVYDQTGCYTAWRDVNNGMGSTCGWS